MPSYGGAVELAEAVIARAPSHDDFGYDVFVTVVALVACCAVHDPSRAGTDRPGPLPALAGPRRVAAGAGRPRCWLRAVRAAGRPAQSFQVTCVHRRLREAVPPLAASDPAASLDVVGAEAIAWMRAVAGPC